MAKRHILRLLNGAGHHLLKEVRRHGGRGSAFSGAAGSGPVNTRPRSRPARDWVGSRGPVPGEHRRPWRAATAAPPRTIRCCPLSERERPLGHVVDCGFGATTGLAALAKAFCQLRDTSRRLILFDTSADPTHRPEFDFVQWGAYRDSLLVQAALRPDAQRRESVPADLRATGYPADQISIARYPRESYRDGSGPLAFLAVTSETYPMNCEAIEGFYGRLSMGGVIAVEDYAGANALDQFLSRTDTALLLVPVAPNYRIGVKR